MTTWKDWADDLTARVAGAVKSRRTALGLTAADLAARTSVGKPLTRAVISDLETGRKKSLEVTELLTLAAALDIPPMLLLFPDYPDGTVEVIPGEQRTTVDAASWFSGTWTGPSSESPENPGVLLVRALRDRDDRIIQTVLIETGEASSEDELAATREHLRKLVKLYQRQADQNKSKVWGEDA